MTADAAKPLQNIRVLDFGHTIMGPCAGLILADLGADVIKVEPYEGDSTRRMPGFAAGFFATFNRNKRSIALDLKTPRGQAALHRLVAGADVLLENFGPGTIERLGCRWEDLAKINPRLIFLSMKGYLKGPYEHRGALDEVVQMQSGIAYMTGPPGQPLRAGASIIDILGAVFGVVAVLAAINERAITGQGKRVGSSLFESAAFLMASHIAGGAVTGEPMRPFPARTNAWGVYDVFETRDGQVFIGITSDAHWSRFCKQFGLAELGGDPRLQSNTDRCANRHWMLPVLKRLFAEQAMADVLAACDTAMLPYAKVGHPDELPQDPHLAAGGLVETAISALGKHLIARLPGLPMEFGELRERTRLERQPPGISEHGEQVLREAGLSPAEVEALVQDRILRRPDAQVAARDENVA
ncbi:CoA transferase [Bradyrhizobium sp. 147]|uniref:CaiB/BaiF CoA transferase family protein n=1 Tax=unclassified Bradyrhizobium TaxID=2631580 RepID=UPI001FF7044D|nr:MULTISPECIES: CaiB/BaiF CoA-transferase family protein [unclassified Bradyrhizobium]MCK1622504.1 CoA transferase [Bradyrhizobium sp. 160]MCK1678213.1 CoA transferase [Bradyrhizobium sp. 147]